ncbi:MAG: acylneuraminate cytidylyltransferase family protein [Opitutae bacterium]|jgi:CMP-N,N'-diacetyllegionaminic acid synthase|nr:acylneuraminate cytidylyltransferase family protein [Opitutae bacterium]
MAQKNKRDLDILAFVLARGGSTGVPGKNIKPINDKPLIGYTLDLANSSRFINKTIVATDCKEIKRVAEEFGAEVPTMRPVEMSQKLSRAYDAYRHYVTFLKNNSNYRPDIFVCLFSTSYTKTVSEVDAAIEKLIDTNCDWVFTVTECEHHPYRCFTPTEDGRIEPFCRDVESFDIWGNRQELPTTYRINGNAFVTWTENIEKFPTYNIDMVNHADTDVRYVLCSQENSMDIDTPTDFKIAEYLIPNS